MLRITVGRKDEDYDTIQEALNAVPYSVPALIEIHEGVYHEKLFAEKSDLTVRGIGNVEITNSDGAREIVSRGMKRGTFRSYTAFFGGERIRLENLAISNRAGCGDTAGQAIALYLDAGYAELEAVRLFSYQDTLFLSPLPDREREERGFYGPRYLTGRSRKKSIIRHSLIEGSVDFIFGGGDALIEDSEIRSSGKGFVAAPSGKKDWNGLVFSRCRFTSSSAEEESVYLMRPWRKEGKAVFISSSFSSHIHPDGFTAWQGLENEKDDCKFLICGCEFSGQCRIPEKHFISREEAERIYSAVDAAAL